MVFRVKKCVVRDGVCRNVTNNLNYFLLRDTEGQEKTSCVRLPRIPDWPAANMMLRLDKDFTNKTKVV